MSHRPQYTVEQLQDSAMRLPGFTSPGDVFSMLEDRANCDLWQTVLSTTIVAYREGQLHVLTGNRSASGNNTHVNVASTPTMRIPTEEAGMLLTEAVPFCLDGKVNPLAPFISKSLSPSVASIPNNTDVLAAKVGHLMALKLGLAQELERAEKPIARASVARCIVGFSYLDDDSSGEPLYAPLIMLGAVVGLDAGIARKIQPTNSYSHLGWVDIGRYTHGVATKNLSEVLFATKPSDELTVCVRGLCNATSTAIVSNPAEIHRHLTEEGILASL